MIIIMDWMRTLYDPECGELMPGAIDLLRNLSPEHRLVLISCREGDHAEHLDAFGIRQYFHSIFLVEEKTEELLRQIIGKEPCVIISDRIRDDIAIGNNVGATTIWLTAGQSEGEEPRSDAERPTHTITSLFRYRAFSIPEAAARRMILYVRS